MQIARFEIAPSIADLDGKPLVTNFISHEDLSKGGVLELEMGSRPRKRTPIRFAAKNLAR